MQSALELAGAELPISVSELEVFRLQSRRHMPTAGLGAHLRRKLGQSLEFRDYRDYVAGDDVRLIDWRASLRRGSQQSLLVKTFEAEERMTVAISIDVRPSMFLPVGQEKMLTALWIARSIATMVQRSRDTLLLHQLFGGQATPVLSVGGNIVSQAKDFAVQAVESAPRRPEAWHQQMPINGAGLMKVLPAAAILVVISDLYFGDIAEFCEFMQKAQKSYRQVVLVVLDSWPWERAMLSSGAVQIDGIEGAHFSTDLLEPGKDELNAMEKRILAHQTEIFHRSRGGGMIYDFWNWPDGMSSGQEGVKNHFCRTFKEFQPFFSLFARVTW